MAKRVRFAEETHRGFDRGVRRIVEAIRPTLGPLPRAVAVQRPDHALLPELLDDGGAIARRIVALPEEGEDSGAMYVRGFLWRIREEAGDGTATAATLFGALLKAGRTALTAGVSAQQLRPNLEAVSELVRDELTRMAAPTEGRDRLVCIARTVCHDDELAGLLGDAFDVAGEFGQIAILPSHRRESWREFVQGAYSRGGALSTPMLADQVRLRSDLIEPALLLTDLDIDDPAELLPVLEAAMASGARGLVITAKAISPRATSLLIANSRPEFPIVAAKIPGFGAEGRTAALQDLALLTGGRVFWEAAGDRLGSIRMADLGRARQAWVDPQHFGIVSGQGDARAVRAHIDGLAAFYDQSVAPSEREWARERLQAFHGVSTTVWVGGDSDTGVKRRLDVATRAVNVLRNAIHDGSVPGGGVALLACRAGLTTRLTTTSDRTERAALRIVIESLEAPFRTILANCGHEPAPALAKMERGAPGLGVDARTGEVVDLRAAGILDPLAVTSAAVTGAIRSVALALTIDTIVHTRSADISVDPQ